MAFGLLARGDDLGVVGRPLHAVVPRQVVIVTVPVILAVGLVVLLVVADQIVQGKPVVGGDEVDAGVGTATVPLIEIGRPGEAIGQLRDRDVARLPVVADRIPVLVVPLAPEGREVTDLVTALGDVPGLPDQLDPV